jgi:hypothetical protein
MRLKSARYRLRPLPAEAQMLPEGEERKIPRSIYEDARDTARALADTEAFEQSRRDRKRVEICSPICRDLFAHLKRILRLGRLRLRIAGSGPESGRAGSLRRASQRTVRRFSVGDLHGRQFAK